MPPQLKVPKTPTEMKITYAKRSHSPGNWVSIEAVQPNCPGGVAMQSPGSNIGRVKIRARIPLKKPTRANLFATFSACVLSPSARARKLQLSIHRSLLQHKALHSTLERVRLPD